METLFVRRQDAFVHCDCFVRMESSGEGYHIVSPERSQNTTVVVEQILGVFLNICSCILKARMLELPSSLL